MTDTLFKQWNTVCGQLQQELGDGIASRWLTKLVPTGLENHQLHLMAPSPCVQELIKKNYANHILTLWQTHNPDITELKFGLKKQPVSPQPARPVLKVSEIISALPKKQIEPPQRGDTDGDSLSSFLNPANTFDSFVVGKPNEFAYAAAKRFAEEMNPSFNPLYLHSSVGL